MPFDPDLRAHLGPIDEPLAPSTQVGHQLIDGFDLVDFCAGGAMVPGGFLAVGANSACHVAPISTEPSARSITEPRSPQTTSNLGEAFHGIWQ
jgi:hypothetical protein